MKDIDLSDGQIWVDIKGYEGLYKIGSFGQVLSVRKNKILNNVRSKIMYEFVTLTKRRKNFKAKVHRLVAVGFIPNPENKYTVNHKNGIRYDNRVENLEWATHKENLIHAFDNHFSHSGEQSWRSKLTESQVKEIILRVRGGQLQKHVAADFLINPSTVNSIMCGRSWRRNNLL